MQRTNFCAARTQHANFVSSLMIFRIKRVITTAFVCHLLLAFMLLTSQLLAARTSPRTKHSHQQKDSAAQKNPAPSPQSPAPPADSKFQGFSADQGEEVVISSKGPQEKDKDVYHLRDDVQIDYRDFTLHADDVIYNAATGDVTATGHVAFDGGLRDEHLEATRGEFNIRTFVGKFENVLATTGMKFKGRNITLTNAEPFTFTGKLVEMKGKDHYVVHNGSVTSCALPDPKWTFNAERIEVDLGGTARLYHSTFRLKNIPAFYFPYAAHPTTANGRQSGFLVPTFGASSKKGTIVGDSFYWAINRSMDATIGAQYYSSRGWEQNGSFRAKPSQKSFIEFSYFGVLDRQNQGGEEAKLNAETTFAHGVRGVTSIDYLSSYVFRQAFTENFSQAVNSEVRSIAFLSKSYRNFFFNTAAARYQNFQSTIPGDVILILHVPGFETSSVDRRLKKSPLFWSYDAAAEGVSRREPGFKTDNLVSRFDLQPRLSIPLFFQGWTFRPEIAMRNTYYSQRQAGPNGPVTDQSLNRRSIEAAVEMRPPTIGRIFEKPLLGYRIKHTLEPRFTYRRVNGVSGFQNIIRFDERDILSDTNEIEYALVQRWFSKRVKTDANCATGSADSAKCQNQSRELLSWEIAQRYYFDPTFGGAIVNGKRNVLTTTAEFTGIAFLTEPRKFSPIISKLRAQATEHVDGSWQLDYDTVQGRINATTSFINYHVGDYFFGGGHAFLHAPGEIFMTTPVPSPDKFNQFRFIVGYGGPNKLGWSSAASVGFDANLHFLQYGSFQASHNWDCCGISTEYRRYALGTVRNENQFRFAFTLANIGTFGNLKRQLSLY
ncbi:MAG: Organic solvent tolerance protein OstA-like protein [Acidobacteriales bacterium]|nr:Organic solvent tolerance protein OstA-like protein [Terriglobales bacterium]